MPSTAVIQVKQGIGDVIWHLPFIRHRGGHSGRRRDVPDAALDARRDPLEAEPGVAEVIYFEHSGSELRRGLHIARLVALLRARNFHRIWILDRTIRPVTCAMLAGIPERIGREQARNRFLTTNPPIDARHFDRLVTDWLAALMAAMNVPLPSRRAGTEIARGAVARIAARMPPMPRPWIVLAPGLAPGEGLAGQKWARLLDTLRRTPGTVFLIGGSGKCGARAGADRPLGRRRPVNACDLSIVEAARAIHHADRSIGPDSGLAELAAAGVTARLRAVRRDAGAARCDRPRDRAGRWAWQADDGMRGFRPPRLKRIEPYLGVVKA